jgi:hypothetical protein
VQPRWNGAIKKRLARGFASLYDDNDNEDSTYAIKLARKSNQNRTSKPVLGSPIRLQSTKQDEAMTIDEIVMGTLENLKVKVQEENESAKVNIVEKPEAIHMALEDLSPSTVECAGEASSEKILLGTDIAQCGDTELNSTAMEEEIDATELPRAESPEIDIGDASVPNQLDFELKPEWLGTSQFAAGVELQESVSLHVSSAAPLIPDS